MGGMTLDPQIIQQRFPRTQAYNPEWIKSIGMGSHPLWMSEWLTSGMTLRPGMRVLDLGGGRAASSIFMAREL
jgi:ubiquinone/menaquinone biosynthesis C-methylase UbiE